MYLREIQICFGGQDERFGLDARHCLFEVAVVRVLFGAVAALPRLEHHEHVFGIWFNIVLLAGAWKGPLLGELSGMCGCVYIPFEVAQPSQKPTMNDSRSGYP